MTQRQEQALAILQQALLVLAKASTVAQLAGELDAIDEMIRENAELSEQVTKLGVMLGEVQEYIETVRVKREDAHSVAFTFKGKVLEPASGEPVSIEPVSKSEMQWTSEVPKVPGWYWTRSEHAKPYLVELDNHQDFLNGKPWGDPWFGLPSRSDGPFEINEVCAFSKREWCGPIPKPGKS